MFNRTINIDAKPDWETFYDPKLVGEYLESLQADVTVDTHTIIEMKPRAVFITPQASLHGFLQWVAAKGDTK